MLEDIAEECSSLAGSFHLGSELYAYSLHADAEYASLFEKRLSVHLPTILIS